MYFFALHARALSGRGLNTSQSSDSLVWPNDSLCVGGGCTSVGATNALGNPKRARVLNAVTRRQMDDSNVAVLLATLNMTCFFFFHVSNMDALLSNKTRIFSRDLALVAVAGVEFLKGDPFKLHSLLSGNICWFEIHGNENQKQCQGNCSAKSCRTSVSHLASLTCHMYTVFDPSGLWSLSLFVWGGGASGISLNHKMVDVAMTAGCSGHK